MRARRVTAELPVIEVIDVPDLIERATHAPTWQERERARWDFAEALRDRRAADDVRS